MNNKAYVVIQVLHQEKGYGNQS